MATTERLMQALRDADAAGDTEAATRFANLVRQQQALQTTPQEPGLFGQIGEMITGEQRGTAITESYPELSGSGLLSGLDPVIGAKIAPVLAVTDDPNELAGILKQAYPDEIGITYDRNVETGDIFPLATNRKTGARAVLNKPGISSQDLLAGTSQGALFAAGGGAPKVIATAGKAPPLVRQAAQQVSRAVGKRPVAASVAGSGAGTAGIEAAQQAAGGQFDIENVLFDMAATFGI